MDREEGITLVNNALESIKDSIEAAGGEFKVVMEVCYFFHTYKLVYLAESPEWARRR